MSGKNKNETVIINDYQKARYEDYEKATAGILLGKYRALLDKITQTNTKIKVLDTGGASGYFAMALYDYLRGKDCEITVIDTAEYGTWGEFSEKIQFMRESADSLENVFPPGTFDIVFANRVFHHFTAGSWKESVYLMNNAVRQISRVLKDSGYFCVTDYFYDGLFFDTSASRMIYALTACKIPLLVKIFRRIEAKSAGTGVCFLSRKMWIGLFDRNNLCIEYTNEGHKIRKSIFRTAAYKICLLIKNAQEDIVIITKKKQTESSGHST